VRRHQLVIGGTLVAALLAAAACSTGGETAGPGTSEEQRISATAVSNASIPVVTRPETIVKVDPADLPAKVQAIRWAPTVSQDEQDCVNLVVYRTVDADPGLASDESALAQVTGRAVAVCLAQDKVADLLTQDLAGKATDEQIACVKNEIVAADPKSLSIFLGGLATGDEHLVASVAKALDVSCGTTLAG
jgi:hypothetical protein